MDFAAPLTLDFSSTSLGNNLGLASGNAFSFQPHTGVLPVGGLGADSLWGTPGPYIPSTTITGPYSGAGTIGNFTQQSIDPGAFHFSPTHDTGDFGVGISHGTGLLDYNTLDLMTLPPTGNTVQDIMNQGIIDYGLFGYDGGN